MSWYSTSCKPYHTMSCQNHIDTWMPSNRQRNKEQSYQLVTIHFWIQLFLMAQSGHHWNILSSISLAICTWQSHQLTYSKCHVAHIVVFLAWLLHGFRQSINQFPWTRFVTLSHIFGDDSQQINQEQF